MVLHIVAMPSYHPYVIVRVHELALQPFVPRKLPGKNPEASYRIDSRPRTPDLTNLPLELSSGAKP